MVMKHKISLYAVIYEVTWKDSKLNEVFIALKAVEAALMELPMINAALVLVKGAEGEDKFLVSYIVPKGQTTKKEVRTALKQRLPFYMIPSYFIFLSR